MQYIELTIHTASEGSELVADVLWDYVSTGIAIRDVNDVIALQQNKDSMYWDYMDDSLVSDPDAEVLVKCFVGLEEAATVIPAIREELEERKALSEGAIRFGSLEITQRIIEGDDWIRIWKEHFRPLHIGPRIVVVPEWIEYEKKPEEILIFLDSNMAFGTGEHETTSMCIECLQEYLTPESVLIDVGCGSGILGIAGVKLGAKQAYMTDIDPIAVESATHNAELNCTADRSVVAHSNLLEDAEIVADVMVANITGEVLVMLSESIPKNLKTGGLLILSGIIESRLEMVKRAYFAQGLTLVKQMQKGEWFALVMKR